MAEFTINGVRYRSGPMRTMSAAHVARKVAPFIPSIAYFIPVREMLAQIKESGTAAQIAREDVDAIVGSVTPTLQQLAAMPDADADFVYAACFSVCEREQSPGAWAPIWNAQAKDFMFQDIDVSAVGIFVKEVLGEVIGPLVAKYLSKSSVGTTESSSTKST